MVADRARRHLHRLHAERPGNAGLHRRPLRTERGKSAGTPAQHRDEKARCYLTQALDMADHFVDPHCRLVAEGSRDRVLAMGATGNRHVGAALSQISHRRQRARNQAKEQSVGLRSTKRSPVCVIFCVVAPQCTHPPCGSPVSRLSSQTKGTMVWPVRANPSSIRTRSSNSKPGRTRDRVRCRLRNDAEFGLHVGKCRFDVEPGLPSVFQAIECANARVRYASGSREFIAHDASSVRLGDLSDDDTPLGGGIRHGSRWQAGRGTRSVGA